MAVIVTERIVIEGGALGQRNFWVPDVRTISTGQKFIVCSKADRNLWKFIGLKETKDNGRPLADNSFMEDLQAKRNRAVDALLLTHLQSSDPMYTELTTLPKNARSMVDPMELAPTVNVLLPAAKYGQESVGPTSIACVCDFTRNRSVSFELTPAALEYVRIAALAAGAVGEERTRKRSKKMTTIPGVCTDNRRKRLYMIQETPDGTRRVSRKPDEWAQPYIDECARQLKLGGSDNAASDAHGSEDENGCEVSEEHEVVDGAEISSALCADSHTDTVESESQPTSDTSVLSTPLS
jgi:hypothetical protein